MLDFAVREIFRVIKEKSSLSLYLLPFTLSLSIYLSLSISLSLYASPFHSLSISIHFTSHSLPLSPHPFHLSLLPPSLSLISLFLLPPSFSILPLSLLCLSLFSPSLLSLSLSLSLLFSLFLYLWRIYWRFSSLLQIKQLNFLILSDITLSFMLSNSSDAWFKISNNTFWEIFYKNLEDFIQIKFTMNMDICICINN